MLGASVSLERSVGILSEEVTEKTVQNCHYDLCVCVCIGTGGLNVSDPSTW